MEADFNVILHEARSSRLRQMPKVENTMLSAGCSGSWYFDWINEKYKQCKRHIGIEYYSPRPDDLPANVDWIVNSVANMSSIKDDSVELIFSGQNIEHLWPEDVVSFLLESHRVLQEDGWLIMDSPNREVTKELCWSHPEHTVELTVNEARELAELSGFEVQGMYGLWLNNDINSGENLDLPDNEKKNEWSTNERLLLAEKYPEKSFVWWMEAKKTGDSPQVDLLRKRMTEIFEDAWVERASRFKHLAGKKVVINNKKFVRSELDESGAILYGPYMPLRKGRYEVAINLSTSGIGDTHVATCDVVGHNDRVIASTRVLASEANAGPVMLNFELPDTEFSIQARCIVTGKAQVTCEFHAEFTKK